MGMFEVRHTDKKKALGQESECLYAKYGNYIEGVLQRSRDADLAQQEFAPADDVKAAGQGVGVGVAASGEVVDAIGSG